MRIVIYICAFVVVAWFTFRIVGYVVKRIRTHREPPPSAPRSKCPKCGSKHLDEYSDRESGYCLDCKHAWGVDMPEDAKQ